jgi:hypothetical protein
MEPARPRLAAALLAALLLAGAVAGSAAEAMCTAATSRAECPQVGSRGARGAARVLWAPRGGAGAAAAP